MSVECRSRCRLSVGRDVRLVSAEMLVECRPRCRSSIGRVTAEMPVECQSR